MNEAKQAALDVMRRYLESIGVSGAKLEMAMEAEERSYDAEVSAVASMPPGGLMLNIGAPCPVHEASRLESIDFEARTFTCGVYSDPGRERHTHAFPTLAFNNENGKAVPV